MSLKIEISHPREKQSHVFCTWILLIFFAHEQKRQQWSCWARAGRCAAHFEKKKMNTRRLRKNYLQLLKTDHLQNEKILRVITKRLEQVSISLLKSSCDFAMAARPPANFSWEDERSFFLGGDDGCVKIAFGGNSKVIFYRALNNNKPNKASV